MPVLNFKGRTAIRSHHFTVPFYPLEIDAKKTFATNPASKPSLEDNLIIHGDNLYALKALVPHYGGKIKCIYIDPPYNTGNENWKYNDNVNNPMMQRWLKENGIGRDDMERHDKWLCMMWPRLELLKVLLADDGVIFISIDDNECYSLKSISDEVFGEENFIGSFIINSAPNGRDYGHIAKNHEYCMFYAKNIQKCQTNLLLDLSKSFTYEDHKGLFNIHPLYNSNEAFHSKNRPNLYYPFYLYKDQPIQSLGKNFYEIGLDKKENAIEIYPPLSQKNKVQFVWRWEKKKSLKEINKEIIGYKTSEGDWRIVQKMRRDKKLIRSILSETNYTSRKGTSEVEEILKGKKFIFPKPMNLIKQFVKVGSDKQAVILDSFAGSGTTAHAVLDLNKEDGGKRKFILVECEDYANSITAERVRRVIKGVPTAKDSKLQKGLGGSFTYCNLGPEFNEEGFLKCKSLPTYEVLARYVFYTATSEALQEFKKRGDYYVGKTKWGIAVFVVYEPNKEFLRSDASALHAQREALVLQTMQMEKCQKAYVFAMACFVPPEDLPQKRIVFLQMPFQIHKMI